MTQFLSMMVYFLTSFYSLSDIPVDQSIHLCAAYPNQPISLPLTALNLCIAPMFTSQKKHKSEHTYYLTYFISLQHFLIS